MASLLVLLVYVWQEEKQAHQICNAHQGFEYLRSGLWRHVCPHQLQKQGLGAPEGVHELHSQACHHCTGTKTCGRVAEKQEHKIFTQLDK